MPGKKFAIIVTSPRPRTGKTMAARLLADYFKLTRESPLVFDTDTVETKLSAYFPGRSALIDLEKVSDQMKLFDTLVSSSQETQIVDLSHRSFHKFFKLMQDINFIEEVKSKEIEPMLFYIPARDQESYEIGRQLRAHYRDCYFVLVENAFLGETGREMRRSADYESLKTNELRLILPQLDPFFAGAVNDPKLSLSEFMLRTQAKKPAAPMPPSELSIAYLSLEARKGISLWLKGVFKDIGRIIEEVESRDRLLSREMFES